MYQKLKNMLGLHKSSRKKRKSTIYSPASIHIEADLRQVIESSQHANNYTYLNAFEDFRRSDDGSEYSSPAGGQRFSAVAEVHASESVEPVIAVNISPKSASDLIFVSQNTIHHPTVSRMQPPIYASVASPQSQIRLSAYPSPQLQKKQMEADDDDDDDVIVESPPTANPFDDVATFFHHFSDLRTDVRIMMANQSLIYLLGTNHADPQCPLDVAKIIKKVNPQLVIIELCAWRACGCDVHRGNVFQTKPQFTFRYLRKVISQIGFLPAMIFFTDAFNEHNAVTGELLDYGSEFAVAARLCQELKNCKILLGDREIPITVKRQASGMGNWRGIRICVLVTLALMFKRRMKGLLLRGHQLVIRDPRFYQIVVLERDIFLTYMLQVAAGMKLEEEKPKIVAVVGQGHLNGIQRFWGRILPQILPLILKPELEF